MRGQVCEHPRRYARDLRRNQTDSESTLWERLRDRRLKGFKFRRQHAIGPFITDFCCTEAKLVVEIDGGQHALDGQCDGVRTKLIEAHGYRVLRFWNSDVLTNANGVLQRIVDALRDGDLHPSPYPLPGGERGSGRPIRMKPSPQRGDGKERGL